MMCAYEYVCIQSKLQSLKNELLFVFTRLFNLHGMAVTDSISNVILDSNTNLSGLEFLLTSWVECHDHYILPYPRKVLNLSINKSSNQLTYTHTHIHE